MSRGTYSVSGSSAAQLYTDIIITDPCTPSLESWRDPLRPTSEFGLGPGYATSLGSGLYDRFRYDPNLDDHFSGGPHINEEVVLKKKLGPNEKLSGTHIPTEK